MVEFVGFSVILDNVRYNDSIFTPNPSLKYLNNAFYVIKFKLN